MTQASHHQTGQHENYSDHPASQSSSPPACQSSSPPPSQSPPPQHDSGDAHLGAVCAPDANLGQHGVDATATVAASLGTDLHADVHVGVDVGHDWCHS